MLSSRDPRSCPDPAQKQLRKPQRVQCLALRGPALRGVHGKRTWQSSPSHWSGQIRQHTCARGHADILPSRVARFVYLLFDAVHDPHWRGAEQRMHTRRLRDKVVAHDRSHSRLNEFIAHKCHWPRRVLDHWKKWGRLRDANDIGLGTQLVEEVLSTPKGIARPTWAC